MPQIKTNPLPDFIKKNYPLQSNNRIKTGGLTSYFAPVRDMSQLQTALIFSRENQLPFYILGNGSNVLINDEAFYGFVIKLEGDFDSISFDHSNRAVVAGAGVSLMKLGGDLAKLGYGGFSYMGVIPGTVGGAVRTNAGIKEGEEIKNNFMDALVLDPENGNSAVIKNEEMIFGHRESLLYKSNKIIIQATFKLPAQKEKDKNKALNAIKELTELRRTKHPKNPKTFGSTFKNPPKADHSAGWHLEKAEMKGMQIGGAMVAKEHANWILNIGHAKTTDVKELIETGQKRVFDKFGVKLEREVIYLPEDMKDWK